LVRARVHVKHVNLRRQRKRLTVGNGVGRSYIAYAISAYNMDVLARTVGTGVGGGCT
jgi:hypothetical protein